MTVKGYPKYRESGIDWLGPVPAHWTVAPLKVAFEVRLGKMLQPERSSETDHLAFYLRAANIQWAGVDTTDLKQMWFSPAEKAQLQLRHGDLLISEGGDVGRSAVWDLDLEECYFQNSINRVRPRLDASTRFLYYWMSTIKDKGYIDVLCNKSTIAHFTAEKVQAVPTPLPPPSEQTAIVAFLDRETGKIDALVEEHRRLIELLNEKRRAIVSHAVTKGLDANAEMKSSGVDWLGDVPEHWDVMPLKWLVSHVVDCLHTTPTYEGELQFPAVRTADVERGVLLLDQARLVSEEVYLERIQRLKPEAGDILYSREGERFGMAALVPQGVDLCLGQRMMMFRVLLHNTPGFLMWALNSEPIYQQVLARTAGATAPHANIGDVINFRIPCPSELEQRRIAYYLGNETSQIDALITEAVRATTLLVERRASLISAAVTGKIDVRDTLSAPTVAALKTGRVRLLVAAELVDLLSHKKSFGRVKLQKLLYLAEADAGIEELQGQYLREAAGPLDRTLIAEVDAGLQQDQHVTVVQSDGPGSQVVYHLRGERGAYHHELVASIGDRAATLRALVKKLGDLDTKSVEAVTTLYAVWNDALLDRGEPTDAMVVSGVLEDWHPEKAKKFKADELHTWLGWMRRQGLVPRGTGPRTTTGRLFA